MPVERDGPSMITIRFVHEDAAQPEFPCRVCAGLATSARPCLTVESPSGRHDLFRCGVCASLYFDGASPVIGYEGFTGDAFWLDYVQAGAGITTMLAPLAAISPLPQGDLIDVGCGFGFVVDYWSKRHGRATGLESSYYGAVGREKLGVDIRPQLLDAYRLSEPNHRFSIVYSSEVIEHTPDPEAFLDDLVAMLAPC